MLIGTLALLKKQQPENSVESVSPCSDRQDLRLLFSQPLEVAREGMHALVLIAYAISLP